MPWHVTGWMVANNDYTESDDEALISKLYLSTIHSDIPNWSLSAHGSPSCDSQEDPGEDPWITVKLRLGLSKFILSTHTRYTYNSQVISGPSFALYSSTWILQWWPSFGTWLTKSTEWGQTCVCLVSRSILCMAKTNLSEMTQFSTSQLQN